MARKLYSVIDLGKVVLIAALDGTYQCKPFENILELLPLAENVIKVCSFY